MRALERRVVAPARAEVVEVGELERQLVVEALQQCDWNRTQASKSLGISYPTLLQKIRKYDLDA